MHRLDTKIPVSSKSPPRPTRKNQGHGLQRKEELNTPTSYSKPVFKTENKNETPAWKKSSTGDSRIKRRHRAPTSGSHRSSFSNFISEALTFTESLVYPTKRATNVKTTIPNAKHQKRRRPSKLIRHEDKDWSSCQDLLAIEFATRAWESGTDPQEMLALEAKLLERWNSEHVSDSINAVCLNCEQHMSLIELEKHASECHTLATGE